MADSTLERKLAEAIRRLKAAEQEQVLKYIQDMQRTRPEGIPGADLLKRAEELDFDPADLEAMRQAIEEGCEGIDLSEW